jgi:hypothetical protein
MYVTNPWVKLFQSAWENRAADARLPLWLRVASLAYARHEANGHNNFHAGELSWILGKSSADGSDFKRRDRHTIRGAIATAVRYGFLNEDSCSTCLVVPPGTTEGPLGNPHKACQVHARKRARRSRKVELLSAAS